MNDLTGDPVSLRSFLDRFPDFASLSDFSGKILYINPAGLELIGSTSLSAAMELSALEFLTPGGLDLAADIGDGLRIDGKWEGYCELRHQVTGAPIPVMVTAYSIDSGDGGPDLVASIIRHRHTAEQRNARMAADVLVAGRHAREQKALADLSRFAVIADLPTLLTAATDTAATLIGVGNSAIAHLELPDDPYLTMDAASGVLGIRHDVPPGDGSLMGFVLANSEPAVCNDRTVETRFRTETMAAFGLRSGVGVPIFDVAGTAWGVLTIHSVEARLYRDEEVSFLGSVAGIVSAAMRRIDLERQLRRRSTHDALTGLPNRTLAYDVIDAALVRARQQFGTVALLLLDIDDFKIINDSLGHDAGDRALVKFVDRLASAIREADTVARLGGDEFLIVCEGVDSVEHAKELARHISSSIAVPFSAVDVPIPLSASIGIAVSDRNSTRQELIHRADLAMYRAKDSGTGGHAVFDPTDLYDADRIRSLSIDLRAALKANELTLAYQPLVEIATRKVVAVEALARWNHHHLGPIEPSEFVSVAERTGLATPLGTWALRTACAAAARWRTFSDIVVRVNVSALQLRDPDFPKEVASVLADTGLPAFALGLEVTETVWVADTERVADTVSTLHSMGITLLLDDMGKGHSSMSYLDRYPMFESFKIDRSYIARLPAPRACAIISAIVALARAFDVTVVGEGVETEEQLEALAAAGCDFAQGFLLGRPVDADAIASLLLTDP
uniref:GGDEF domain-containing protein n=1 Tax=unclassified Rhodococcus (in: high G+C Gram-positive bacteria) TaxID=192944 RepID=UPI0011407544|nr:MULTISPECIES: GGDEF domain-containing protein [unclassified Rhodococcus (in: high G+C Gram-positive bacteria)]